MSDVVTVMRLQEPRYNHNVATIATNAATTNQTTTWTTINWSPRNSRKHFRVRKSTSANLPERVVRNCGCSRWRLKKRGWVCWSVSLRLKRWVNGHSSTAKIRWPRVCNWWLLCKPSRGWRAQCSPSSFFSIWNFFYIYFWYIFIFMFFEFIFYVCFFNLNILYYLKI